MKKKSFLILNISLACAVLAVVLAANIAMGIFSHAITMALMGSGANYESAEAQEAYDYAADIAQNIQEEGTVLLKNENDALPLKDVSQVNVFGWASTAIYYGGSGSGTSNSLMAKSFAEALEGVNIKANPALTEKYKNYRAERPSSGVGSASWELPEPALSTYSESDWTAYKNYSDVAIMVISRNGGEGNDLPAGYLTATQTELDLLGRIGETFGTVIVVINTGNAMELGFLDNDYVDAAMYIGFPGCRGLEGVANIIKGSVNPSGRLADTYAYDSTSAPSYAIGNAADGNTGGVFQYSDKGGYYFVDYNEGIYMGYRYYETRFASDSTSFDGTDYETVVQYPFGYGIGYSDFPGT